MPYVVGTYPDRKTSVNSLLRGEMLSLKQVDQAIRWQLQGGSSVRCNEPLSGPVYQTAWHVCDPLGTPFHMRCRVCGTEMIIGRGAFTWEAFHQHARKIWGELPPTVAELRLSLSEL